uniref:SSD domain-containing protein n=1 Tax=Haemonchus contortus TaxID=6289 RepID=A0A7I4Y5P3_HAECO
MEKNARNGDTWFITLINYAFKKIGYGICYAPWTCIVLSFIMTGLLSLKIPLTEMENNISDFTPYEARSRKELKIYREFFSNRGEPKAIYAFVYAKDGGNLLKTSHLNETVKVLDKISHDFYLQTSKGEKNFEQFCQGFCTLNEPVRHFYSGMLIADKYGNDTRHLDLGYPITTVLGTKLFMDPNLFGVKIAVTGDQGEELVVSTANRVYKDSLQNQLPNNIREVALIVLQFRAEIGSDVQLTDMNGYERSIVGYFQNFYKSDFISVYVLTDSFITSEIVRAGLSLLPFLVIGFVIMATFSCVTFSISGIVLKQMNVHKITLAVMACVCPFMACGATLGAMFWCGFRFGSILCVTPFLVLAIGVDDAYLMMNAWQRITAHRRGCGSWICQPSSPDERPVIRSHGGIKPHVLVVGDVLDPVKTPADSLDSEIRHRIVEMLVETGPSVSITTITNVLAFGIGAFTPTPEIQLFSIGNALAVVVDFIFQITIYAALMVIVGRYEIEKEMNEKPAICDQIPSEKSSTTIEEPTVGTRILDAYCDLISNKYFSSLVIAVLAVYWYISIVGTINIKPELSPHKLFLSDSDLVKIFDARKQYISTYYSVCWVLVKNPGDVMNETISKRIHHLVEDFESLPNSVGSYSTKFWLRDYEDFHKQGQELENPDEFEEMIGTGIEFSQNGSSMFPSVSKTEGNELKQFLEWPEFSFWKGFLQVEPSQSGKQYKVSRFFFTTAFHGEELTEWSSRATLLNQWRALADKYADLEVSVYEDDAKFLDLIETMVPISMQSALFTFVSMFAVAVLFISHPPTLFVATLSILSTSIGVFGIMSLMGADLDPIMMSATVMSIGFSVDIPSHISYHYYQTAKETSCVKTRLKKTVAAVGFPIMQASLSTTLCVLSLFFVQLHMSRIFAQCMLLVVLIGMIHGLLIIPVIFNLIAALPSRYLYRR